MKALKKYQNIIIIAVVVIVGFALYTVFSPGKATPILSEQVIAENSPVDQDLISLLLELKGITLDESLFSESAFVSLQDFSKELVPEAVGRPNPFAPLGSAQPKAQSSATQ